MLNIPPLIWRLMPGAAKIQPMKSLLHALRRPLVALGGCLVACLALAQSLEIIDLKYRTAQEVIPILQPLLESGGALTGSDYKLFVRASSANVAQLRRAIAEIDRKPRQLLVSVRRATRQTIEREAAAASVVIGSNGSGAKVVATDSTSQRQGTGIASVQVLEGNAAYIATGQSIPVISAVVAGGRRPWIATSTSYRDLNSGFLVTPRLSGQQAGQQAGQQVVLDISQQAEQAGTDASGIQTQHLSTQVAGALDQWISLGGVQESATSQRSGILSRKYTTQSDDLEVWVRVEEQ